MNSCDAMPPYVCYLLLSRPIFLSESQHTQIPGGTQRQVPKNSHPYVLAANSLSNKGRLRRSSYTSMVRVPVSAQDSVSPPFYVCVCDPHADFLDSEGVRC